MSGKHYPEWAAKRARGNRIIALVLVGLVVLYLALFFFRYVAK